MNSQILTSATRILRGLFAAVFVVCNLFHGGSCCCDSLSCCESQDDGCCDIKTTQKSCCCQKPSDSQLAKPTCCCAGTSPQSSACCEGICQCSEPSVTVGIVATHQRIERKQVEKKSVDKTWLTDFGPLTSDSKSFANVDLRRDQQFPGDPCAHNLRQSILCVWRN